MPSVKKQSRTTVAEVALIDLKSCLVNLPGTLLNVLVDANTVSFALWHSRAFMLTRATLPSRRKMSLSRLSTSKTLPHAPAYLAPQHASRLTWDGRECPARPRMA